MVKTPVAKIKSPWRKLIPLRRRKNSSELNAGETHGARFYEYYWPFYKGLSLKYSFKYLYIAQHVFIFAKVAFNTTQATTSELQKTLNN
jgi:hypothetical protein